MRDKVADQSGDQRRGTVPKRKIIVNIATSADGYIARTDGNLDWLTNRPAKGFYGLPNFSRKHSEVVRSKRQAPGAIEEKWLLEAGS